MKRLLVWSAPLLILALSVVARIADPAPVEHIRLLVFDELQRLARAHWQDVDVRVVDIDDELLARHGQWPWPRTVVAQLIERLHAGGAAAIALDIVFAEPDRTSPRQVAPLWGDTPDLARLARDLPDHDTLLAETIARTPTVIGMPLVNNPGARPPRDRGGFAIAGDDPRPFLIHFTGAVANLPELDQAAPGAGSFTTGFERDGVIRRVPLVAAIRRPDGPSQLIPSLAAEALRVAQGAGTYIVRSSGASGQTAFGEHTGVNAVRIGAIEVPTDPGARVWLRDPGPVPARVIPAWRVLAGELPEEEIDGRIFFVGTGAPGLRDVRATPLNPTAAGVDVHARIAEQMLCSARPDGHDCYLERPDTMTAAELGWLIVFGGVVIVLIPLGGAVVAALIGGAGVILPFAISLTAMVKAGFLLDPVYPAATVLLIYLVQSLLVFNMREAERRQVRDAFSRYLSPTVVETLARHPERLRLGGEMRELTVMFSDIRGFTTRSERMQPEELTQFLNGFLTPMTDSILRHGGTIDKYMGDAVMAFWNAPLDEPDHPVKAARAALDMMASLDALNAELAAEAQKAGAPFEPIGIGIGLNCGMACVGNMGSRQRFDYSVIGDNVNLASRLEGLSKNYGTSIIMAEGLANRLDGFAIVPLDDAQVRGKAQRVRISTLLGDQTAVTPAVQLLARAHAEILAALESGNPVAAAAALVEAQGVGDARFAVVHALYEERIHKLSVGETIPAASAAQ